MKKLTGALLAFSLAAPGLALAADDEITMEVIDGETPEQVTRQIELPEAASDEARSRSGSGVETANRARERNREQVREMAEENGEAARERQREMQEHQQQIREQREQMQQQLQEQQDSTRDATEYRQGQ